MFEPRIETPENDVDDPKEATVSWSHALDRSAKDRHGTALSITDEEDPEELAERWDNAECDAAVLWLAGRGWRIECMLDGTERDGWYGRLFGRCGLYLCSRSGNALPASNPVWGRTARCEPQTYDSSGAIRL